MSTGYSKAEENQLLDKFNAKNMLTRLEKAMTTTDETAGGLAHGSVIVCGGDSPAESGSCCFLITGADYGMPVDTQHPPPQIVPLVTGNPAAIAPLYPAIHEDFHAKVNLTVTVPHRALTGNSGVSVIGEVTPEDYAQVSRALVEYVDLQENCILGGAAETTRVNQSLARLLPLDVPGSIEIDNRIRKAIQEIMEAATNPDMADAEEDDPQDDLAEPSAFKECTYVHPNLFPPSIRHEAQIQMGEDRAIHKRPRGVREGVIILRFNPNTTLKLEVFEKSEKDNMAVRFRIVNSLPPKGFSLLAKPVWSNATLNEVLIVPGDESTTSVIFQDKPTSKMRRNIKWLFRLQKAEDTNGA
ncbi:MAG: hypothetical protein KIT79_10055 [Deltaproteobacteria bacterium]|nr:hypothetical protein [Deltaproteobacteria bacterium]